MEEQLRKKERKPRPTACTKAGCEALVCKRLRCALWADRRARALAFLAALGARPLILTGWTAPVNVPPGHPWLSLFPYQVLELVAANAAAKHKLERRRLRTELAHSTASRRAENHKEKKVGLLTTCLGQGEAKGKRSLLPQRGRSGPARQAQTEPARPFSAALVLSCPFPSCLCPRALGRAASCAVPVLGAVRPATDGADAVRAACWAWALSLALSCPVVPVLAEFVVAVALSLCFARLLGWWLAWLLAVTGRARHTGDGRRGDP